MSERSSGRQWQRVNSSKDLSSMIEGGSTLSVHEHPDHSYLASPTFMNREVAAQKAARAKLALLNKETSRRGVPEPHHDQSPTPASPPPREYRRDGDPRRRSSLTQPYHDENGGQEDVFSSQNRRSRREAPSLTSQNSCSDFVRSNHDAINNGTSSRSSSTRGYSDNDRPNSIPAMPRDPLMRGSSGGSRGGGDRLQQQQQHPYSPSPRRSPHGSTRRPGAYSSSVSNSFDEVTAKLELDRQQSIGSPRNNRGGSSSSYDHPRLNDSSPRGERTSGYDRHYHQSNSPRGRRTPSPTLPVYQQEPDHRYHSSSSYHGSRHYQHEPHRPSRRYESPEPTRRYEQQQDRHHPSSPPHSDRNRYHRQSPPHDRYDRHDRHDREREAEQMIEIAPGTHARLRGAQETWECVERDFYAPVNCIVCNLDLCCIMDANYVLCPACRVVSPMEGSSSSNGNEDGGVGLGFTFQDLQRWQMEILAKRNGGQR